MTRHAPGITVTTREASATNRALSILLGGEVVAAHIENQTSGTPSLSAAILPYGKKTKARAGSEWLLRDIEGTTFTPAEAHAVIAEILRRVR